MRSVPYRGSVGSVMRTVDPTAHGLSDCARSTRRYRVTVLTPDTMMPAAREPTRREPTRLDSRTLSALVLFLAFVSQVVSTLGWN